MMKKWILTVLASMMALTLASCGAEGTDAPANNTAADTVQNTAADTKEEQTAAVTEAPAETKAPDAPAEQTEGFLVTLEGGVSIRLGDPADSVIPSLGEYSDFMEAPSCIHDGNDKVYTYNGAYTVTTSPDASGAEYVAEVALISDAVGMEYGENLLLIGAPASDLEAAFGAPLEDTFGVRKYALEGGILTATVDGDLVTAFVISYPAK